MLGLFFGESMWCRFLFGLCVRLVSVLNFIVVLMRLCRMRCVVFGLLFRKRVVVLLSSVCVKVGLCLMCWMIVCLKLWVSVMFLFFFWYCLRGVVFCEFCICCVGLWFCWWFFVGFFLCCFWIGWLIFFCFWWDRCGSLGFSWFCIC